MLQSRIVSRLMRQRSSLRRCGIYTQVSQEEKMQMHPELVKFAELSPTPVSMQEILTTSEVPINEVAAFIQKEYCIRCAKRILMMEEWIPEYQSIPEFQKAHQLHVNAFAAVQNVGDMEHDTQNNFRKVVRQVVEETREMVPLMCMGMCRLIQHNDNDVDEEFVNKFLDEFLLSRIGSNVVMSHYNSLFDNKDGIIDPHCNVKQVCQETADKVAKLCENQTGFSPTIQVQAYSASENDESASFAYIPAALSYILQELLKNSCVATAELGEDEDRPIAVIVCADDRRIMINISDQAGGIPFDVGQHIWSYLYTTTRHQQGTELGGFGVGLPLSRLYASYLGGSLNLVSLPGYGTHAYVFLPRLPENLVEVVPGRDKLWDPTKSFGEFIL